LDDFQDSMLEVFVFETNQFLDNLEKILLDSEENKDGISSSVPEIFRIMHTIKSSSAMMSFDGISKLAHSIEDLFFYIRENNPPNIDESKLTDILLDCVDFIKRNMQSETQEDPSEKIKYVSLFLSDIKNLSVADEEKNSIQELDLADNKKAEKSAAQPQEEYDSHKLLILFKSGCQMVGLRAFEVEQRLKKNCQTVVCFPEDASENQDEFISKEGFFVEVSTEKTMSEIKTLIEKSPFVEEVIPYAAKPTVLSKPETAPALRPGDIDFVERRKQSEEDSASSKKKTPSAQTNVFANVAVSKLDYLVDTVGELIVAEMGLETNFENKDLLKTKKSISDVKKLILIIQETALSTRMFPLKETFQKLNRIVRDICKKQGKDVQIITEGEGTEVDRSVVDSLSSPLMHIVRNAIDHGIETVEERAFLGKPAQGRLELSAKTDGRNVMITVSDDGRGLNREKIVEKALSLELIPPERALKMSEEEMNALIFMPGFSTSSEVTEYSGRGVGMDIVNTTMKKLNGKLIVNSKDNEGTNIVLKIPLTLAVIDAVIIRIGNETCAISTNSVVEIFKPGDKNAIKNVNGDNMVLLRDECYKMISLFDFYGQEEIPAYTDGMMVVVKSDSKNFVIFASEVINQLNIVLKPVPKIFTGVKGVCGCTILGDGNISLILDTSELVNFKKGDE